MGDRNRRRIDDLKQWWKELIESLGEVLTPRPELVPVPVKPKRGRD